MLILKINFKKYYFDIFVSEKYFKKQLLLYYQGVFENMVAVAFQSTFCLEMY